MHHKKKVTKPTGGGGGFQSYNLDPPLFKAIQAKGYNLPTPIQRRAIPIILQGFNVIAMARTGSGKTGAFIIPIVQKLA
jgi:ATP-dependent RNA helicase DDX54/DBP10